MHGGQPSIRTSSSIHTNIVNYQYITRIIELSWIIFSKHYTILLDNISICDG